MARCKVCDTKGFVNCKLCLGNGIRSGDPCKHCNGTGMLPCPACKGTGEIK